MSDEYLSHVVHAPWARGVVDLHGNLLRIGERSCLLGCLKITGSLVRWDLNVQISLRNLDTHCVVSISAGVKEYSFVEPIQIENNDKIMKSRYTPIVPR